MKTDKNSKLADLSKKKLYVQVIFSTIVLGVSIYMILSKQYSDETNKWAYGMIGLIMGYWLSANT